MVKYNGLPLPDNVVGTSVTSVDRTRHLKNGFRGFNLAELHTISSSNGCAGSRQAAEMRSLGEWKLCGMVFLRLVSSHEAKRVSKKFVLLVSQVSNVNLL